MPIQVIPAARQKSHRYELVGQALGQAVGLGIQAYSHNQKQKQFSQAMQNIEKNYNNPEMNEQQRLISAFRELGQFPEAAQQLGGHLSRLGGQQEKFKNKILSDKQDQERLAQSFQKIQDLYHNPDMSEEQKMFALYEELNKNPTLAKNIIGSLQQQEKSRGEETAGTQFSAGYNAILEGDNDTLKSVLEDPATPLSIKQKLTALRDKQDTRKSVQARELRGRQSLVQKSYKSAISSERDKLKDPYVKQPEIASINKQIKKLEALQKHDLKRLAKNQDSYTSLSLWNNLDPDFLPEEESDELIGMEAEQEKPQRKKLESNAERQEIARQLLREAGGDKQAAMKLFEERYE